MVWNAPCNLFYGMMTLTLGSCRYSCKDVQAILQIWFQSVLESNWTISRTEKRKQVLELWVFNVSCFLKWTNLYLIVINNIANTLFTSADLKKAHDDELCSEWLFILLSWRKFPATNLHVNMHFSDIFLCFSSFVALDSFSFSFSNSH